MILHVYFAAHLDSTRLEKLVSTVVRGGYLIYAKKKTYNACLYVAMEKLRIN